MTIKGKKLSIFHYFFGTGDALFEFWKKKFGQAGFLSLTVWNLSHQLKTSKQKCFKHKEQKQKKK